MSEFHRGLKLYGIARKRAESLGLVAGTKGMTELIRSIQEREGNTPCFRKRKSCRETSCSWQASCGAEMVRR